ncbi:hypothetical protein FACS1894151_06750 [Spirochaetia bacterium]|nr:hypothetical protein FACS1894151_06750 [Spirochaetia bacterium]
MKNLFYLIGSIGLLIFVITNTYSNEVSDEMSEYNIERIENGELKPLYLLESTDKNKYEIIIECLPKNEKEESYYYSINITIKLKGNASRRLTLEEYIKSIEHEEIEIEKIEYGIWYYERLKEEYDMVLGDPTGKCFTVTFNREGNFIGKYYWR